jgi:hypothetical protein
MQAVRGHSQSTSFPNQLFGEQFDNVVYVLLAAKQTTVDAKTKAAVSKIKEMQTILNSQP